MSSPRRVGALRILLAAMALAVLHVTGPAAGATATKQPTIRAIAHPAKVQAGETFTVDIRARRMKGAAAVAFHLVYDPALVVPVMSGSTEGPLFGRGGARTSFLARAGSTGDRVVLGIARLGAGGSGASKGLLCRLTFRAVSNGTALLAFDQAQVSNPVAGTIPATFQPGSLLVGPGRGGAGE